MTLTIGIVGLPNVGKSTLFNALTKNDVLAANYPFATIEPNVGVVGVPDDRLDQLAEVFGSAKIIPATVSFVDIAGIVKGASEGQGLGNKFLATIRDSDAICQVIRVFSDPDVVHVDGQVSPKSDMETINTELILADLQTVDKVLPRLERESKLVKEKKAQVAAVAEARAVLDSGQTVFAAGLDLAPLRELHLLTAKPFLYVFNMDSAEIADEALQAELRALVAPSEAIFLDAKIESELIELDEAEALELLQSHRPAGVRAEPARPRRLRDPRPADVPDGRAERSPRLDDPQRRDRPRGRRRHPHRLPARLHQGRDRRLRRPHGRPVDGRGESPRPGADRG